MLHRMHTVSKSNLEKGVGDKLAESPRPKVKPTAPGAPTPLAPKREQDGEVNAANGSKMQEPSVTTQTLQEPAAHQHAGESTK